MKKFVIYTNPHKDPEKIITNRVKSYLLSKGATIIEDYTNIDEDTMIIVLGGDGTMLQAIRELQGFKGLVIGINMGTLGFLTEIEPEYLEESLERLLLDDYSIEKRMLLEGSVSAEGEDKIWALNDIVLTRNGGLSIIKFEIYVNGQLLHRYSADGMIVATPTGSTGYNLSAMGPIASPAAELIILTPVCPHSLGQRSVILSATDVIEIVIPPSKDGTIANMEVSFDGASRKQVKTGDRVVVSKSNNYVQLAKLSKDSFLDTLGKKFSE